MSEGFLPGWWHFARKGQLTLGATKNAEVYVKLPPLLKRQKATELLDEERGTRGTFMRNPAPS